MSFDLPRGVIFPVEAVAVRLDPGPHPFEQGRQAEIAKHWLAEKSRNPALFDGRVALLSRLAYRDGRLEGRCHEVGYSTFLYWRANGDRLSAAHAFAHAVLVASDNALLAIRMGSHTVNAGSVYFAAGSFEPQDFPNGAADVDGNMIREVREETALDISAAPRDRRWHALSFDGGTVIFRRFHLNADAETVAEGIRRFVAAEPDPEIEEPVVIREGEPLPAGLRPHMPALIAWHFSGAE